MHGSNYLPTYARCMMCGAEKQLLVYITHEAINVGRGQVAHLHVTKQGNDMSLDATFVFIQARSFSGATVFPKNETLLSRSSLYAVPASLVQGQSPL